MDLIKENIEKARSVYLNKNSIRKYWDNKSFDWVMNHVKILDKLMPGYIKGAGVQFNKVYIDMNILPGTRADSFEHTTDFIRKIYQFCIEENKRTQPYYHGDWVLSNMFIDNDIIRLCDWDNVGKHSENEVKEKLYSDLYSAFGDKFKEIYDTTTI